jgi:hypothetical protein
MPLLMSSARGECCAWVWTSKFASGDLSDRRSSSHGSRGEGNWAVPGFGATARQAPTMVNIYRLYEHGIGSVNACVIT